MIEQLEVTTGRPLRWVESGALESQLRLGDDLVATLAWAKRWSSLATARSDSGTWTLKRTGFLRPQVTIREEGSGTNLAVVAMTGGGDGVLDFADGPSFRLRGSGVRHPGLTVFDTRGRTLLILALDPGGKNHEASVEIERSDPDSAGKLLLLMIVSWYVALLMSRYDYESGDITGSLVATWS
jgi:hypothetical protein